MKNKQKNMKTRSSRMRGIFSRIISGWYGSMFGPLDKPPPSEPLYAGVATD